jgi:hypothetical protein
MLPVAMPSLHHWSNKDAVKRALYFHKERQMASFYDFLTDSLLPPYVFRIQIGGSLCYQLRLARIITI